MNFSIAELVSIPPRMRALLLAAVLFLFAALVVVAGYLAVTGSNERMLLAALSAAQFVGTGAAALAILLLSSRSLRPSALRRETTHFLRVEIPHALKRCNSGVPHDLSNWSSRRDDTVAFYGELHVDHERETPTGTYLVRYQGTYLLFRVVMNAKKLLVMYFLKTDSAGLDHLRDAVLGVTVRGRRMPAGSFMSRRTRIRYPGKLYRSSIFSRPSPTTFCSITSSGCVGRWILRR